MYLHTKVALRWYFEVNILSVAGRTRVCQLGIRRRTYPEDLDPGAVAIRYLNARRILTNRDS